MVRVSRALGSVVMVVHAEVSYLPAVSGLHSAIVEEFYPSTTHVFEKHLQILFMIDHGLELYIAAQKSTLDHGL